MTSPGTGLTKQLTARLLLITLITAMLIHATVEFNFQIPPNAAMFVVLLALCWISLFNNRSSMNLNK